MVKLTTANVLEVTGKEILEQGEEWVNHFFTLGYVTSNEFDALLRIYNSHSVSKVEVYFGEQHADAFLFNGCTQKEIRIKKPGAEETRVVSIFPVAEFGAVGLGNYVEVNRNTVVHSRPHVDFNKLNATICHHSNRKITRRFEVGPRNVSSHSAECVLRVFIPQERVRAGQEQ